MTAGYILGFTGTRDGMTPEQRDSATSFIARLMVGCSEAEMAFEGLHGDCVGADADFHQICRDEGVEGGAMKQRPCTFSGMRAHTDALEISKPEKPMARNQKIVDDCDALLACPPTDFEIERGSGTWATIRMGRKANRQVVIVYPDGSVVEDCSGELEDEETN